MKKKDKEIDEKYKELEEKFLKCSDLKKIKVIDNNEYFVSLSELKNNNLLVGYFKDDMRDYFNSEVIVRKKVADKILNISKYLKKKYPHLSLYVFYGYRSIEIQKQYFSVFLEKNRKKGKYKNIEELYEITHRGVACPEVAGHPTGGAIDITLYDNQKKEFVDMGSDIADYGSKKSYYASPELSKKQKLNREFLRKIMQSEGFAPYDGEWWHFSYGDKEWAKFYNKTKAIYKQVKLKDVKLKNNMKKNTKIELDFTKVSPGGNMTILIWNPKKINKKDYPKISNFLMDTVYGLGAEQVAFVEKAKNKKAIVRMEMMGGEFCGNALRSLAFMLVMKNKIKTKQEDGSLKFLLESSGVDNLLEVEVFVDEENQPYKVKVEMPIFRDKNSVKKEGIFTIVKLKGITQIIVDESDLKFNQNNYKQEFIKIRDRFGLSDELAVGVIWKSKVANKISIKPVIWVRNTDSYYYETSCASGTIATALSEVKNESNSDCVKKYDIYQPSGSKIIASIKKYNDSFSDAYIEGGVDVIAEGKAYILKNKINNKINK